MPNIVRGQRVQAEKVALARRLRREMTSAEQLLWQRLRKSALGVHFRRQQIIDGFIVDFYCHSARVVVEVDGAVHKLQADYDHGREEALARRDLLTIRFTNDEICDDLDGVVDQIEQVCRERET